MEKKHKIDGTDRDFVKIISTDIYSEEVRKNEIEYYFRDFLSKQEKKNVEIDAYDWSIKIVGHLPNGKNIHISCKDVGSQEKLSLFVKRFHNNFIVKFRNEYKKSLCAKEINRICGDKLNFLLIKDEYDKYLFYEEVLKKINKISYQARKSKTKQMNKIVNEMAEKLGIDKKVVEHYKDYILKGCKDMFGNNYKKDGEQ